MAAKKCYYCEEWLEVDEDKSKDVVRCPNCENVNIFIIPQEGGDNNEGDDR